MYFNFNITSIVNVFMLSIEKKQTSPQVLFQKTDGNKLNTDIHWFGCFSLFFPQIRCTPTAMKTLTLSFISVKYFTTA